MDQTLINSKILGYEDAGPFACLGPQRSALALLACWTLLISPANFCSHWEERLETGGSEALDYQPFPIGIHKEPTQNLEQYPPDPESQLFFGYSR